VNRTATIEILSRHTPMLSSALGDWLKSWPLAALPHHLLSRVVRSATRWRVPWWKNLLITRFIRHFRVDMSEAVGPSPAQYADFNSFFTRALKPDLRPQPEEPLAISSPVDGRISQIGRISNGRMLQAKGRDFSLVDLLGGNTARARPFQEGAFTTLYLSPRDYHRVHMPCDARLVETVYVPGRLFSVAPHTTRAIPRLFTRNERLAALFETDAGPMAMVLVGAIFVACMETVWEGVIQPVGARIVVRDYPQQNAPQWRFRRGDEMGRFNMGSTVILVHEAGRAEWRPDLRAGQAVRMGQMLGRLRPAP
jgi:phosphatidylserine decarboxylase